MKKLPFYNDAYFNYELTIADSLLDFTFEWVPRTALWFMSIANSKKTLIDSVPLQINQSLISHCYDFSFPDGDFLCLRNDNKKTDPNYFDMINDTCSIYFVTLEELKEVYNAN